jgi:hypothetical protein
VALIERFDPVLDAVGEPTKGAGQIAHFERRLNTGTGWSTSGFWIVRQDSTETDFSYIDAVKGKPKGRSQDFYNACGRRSHSTSSSPRSMRLPSTAMIRAGLSVS